LPSDADGAPRRGNNPARPAFTPSLIHSFTHSLIHSFTHSLIHSITHSLIHSITHSLIQTSPVVFLLRRNTDKATFHLATGHCPLSTEAASASAEVTARQDAGTIRPPLRQTHFNRPSKKGTLPRCFPPSPAAARPAFTHSLIHSFTHSLIHSFTHSLIHSFTHSLIHSFRLHPLFSASAEIQTRPLSIRSLATGHWRGMRA
jgi:hypothetical protein